MLHPVNARRKSGPASASASGLILDPPTSSLPPHLPPPAALCAHQLLCRQQHCCDSSDARLQCLCEQTRSLKRTTDWRAEAPVLGVEAEAGAHREPCVCVGCRGTRCFLRGRGERNWARRWWCCRPCWRAFGARLVCFRRVGPSGGSRLRARRLAVARRRSASVAVGGRLKGYEAVAVGCTSRWW